MNLLKGLQNAWHLIISDSEKELVDFVQPMLASLEQNGGKVLKDAAMAAVTTAASMPGSGEAKAAAAFTSVVAVLASEGIPVATNAVKGAIEIAYANYTAAQAPVASPAPAPAPVAA